MSAGKNPIGPINGVLIVDKPGDWTSHDVCQFVRKKFSIPKVGHAGILDRTATGVLVVLLVISISTGGFGNSSTEAVADANTAPTAQGNEGIIEVSAQKYTDDDPFLGDKNAPLTIVEFSDFQCPYCGRFHEDAFQQIKEQYIDTGKVKFVYRDFPLSFHPMAMPSALASECADEQGMFWEYHNMIFTNQASLSESLLKQFAVDLGLNTGQFNECFDSQKYASEIQNDLKDASASGGRGTPYFLVGNVPVSGAQPFANFQQVIETQL